MIFPHHILVTDHLAPTLNICYTCQLQIKLLFFDPNVRFLFRKPQIIKNLAEFEISILICPFFPRFCKLMKFFIL
jgi:hypothetical protein